MRHGTMTFPVLYGDLRKAEAQTLDQPIKSESNPAYMLVFALAYGTGVMLTLASVAMFYFWRS
jgi:hypothetical protein